MPQLLHYLRPTRWATGLCIPINNCLAGKNVTWTHELYTDMDRKLLCDFLYFGIFLCTDLPVQSTFILLGHFIIGLIWWFPYVLELGLFLPVVGITGTGTIELLGPAASITTSSAGTLGGTRRR